ncbi:MAG: 4-hydroxy-tetrahydrodipicolinate reductase [Betaproteobacteria bacterium]|nr:MAG: 4-hydroxy-tetrahydrodipicolinate reductase [Betaproteobacteria bacterium]
MKLAIAGASGRMGRALLEAVLSAPDLELHAALEQPGNPAVGRDAGELVGSGCGVRVSDDPGAAIAGADALIDFTRPEGSVAHLRACRASRVKMVIGTTGFSPEQRALFADAAREIGIVMAPNMSVGTNLVFKLIATAAQVLNEGYDVEIIEAHHRHKVDAPSGTALRMGEIVAAALGRDLSKCAVHGREGVTGERDAATIGFSAIRGGDIVGEHTVLFAGVGERVEVTVKASSRATYAQGAVRAARWLQSRPAGLYDMQAVLGLI